MNKLRNLLYICFSFLILLFLSIAGVYFFKFSYGISEKPDDWLLFISMCNWGFISLLTGLNVWVFYKLTSMFAFENKISRSENAILDLRLSDYKQLRVKASKIKIAVLKNGGYDIELNTFMQVLYAMSVSPSFYTTTFGKSALLPIVEKFETFLLQETKNGEELINLIDRSLSTIELLIFSNQLRDERILEQIRKHPSWFDSTLNSIDNYMKKYEKSC